MCAIPIWWRSRGSECVRSLPSREMVPPVALRNPVNASTNSVCPLPCTPAIPTISPARTSKETFSTCVLPSASSTVKSVTFSTTSPADAEFFCTVNSTGRPTIISAICDSVAVFGSTSPTTLPRRNTAIRSAILSASFSLCVMNTTPRPAETRVFTISKNSMISLGVSTAVGSSNTTTFASRSNTFTISTRC